jgi:hypothetical protein
MTENARTFQSLGRLARDELHHDERMAGWFPDVVDRDDVGMVEE